MVQETNEFKGFQSISAPRRGTFWEPLLQHFDRVSVRVLGSFGGPFPGSIKAPALMTIWSPLARSCSSGPGWRDV